MTAVLQVRGVSRLFAGGAGVRAMDLTVEAGQIHAVVGLNGAGKSTLIKLVLGMLRPAAGEVLVAGVDVRTAGPTTWRQVGAMVETPLAYPALDGLTNLRLAARLHGVAPAQVGARVDTVVREIDLGACTRVRAGRMSLGNRQRLGLAAALVHDPRLVVLDEPTNALDPSGVIRLRESLQRRAADGAAVLVSSHHLDEVARIARTITVVADGLVVGTLDPTGVDIERAFFATVHAAEAAS